MVSINGFLIVKMKVPDLLATLGMMFVLLGVQRIPTEGNSIATGMALPDGTNATGAFSPAFLALGRLRLWDVLPLSVVFLLVIAVLVWGFLELTRHGRLMYAIGSNAQAAALAGTNVQRYKVAAYVISGRARLGRGTSCSRRGSGAGTWPRATTCCSTPWRRP